MDWIAITRELRVATVAAVDLLSTALEKQRLYAVCLQTADDGMSVDFCANTEEGYAEKRASEAKSEAMCPDYAADLCWAPAEWRYEGFGDDLFADINRDLTAASATSTMTSPSTSTTSPRDDRSVGPSADGAGAGARRCDVVRDNLPQRGRAGGRAANSQSTKSVEARC